MTETNAENAAAERALADILQLVDQFEELVRHDEFLRIRGDSEVSGLEVARKRLLDALARERRQRDAATRALEEAREITSEAATTLTLAREGSRQWELRSHDTKRRIREFLANANAADDADAGAEGE